MSPYLRKVKTASGAKAVQVVVKENGVRRIVEHLDSAHDEAELATLMHLGHQRLLVGQQVLDLGSAFGGGARRPVMSRVMMVRCEGLRSSPAGRAG